MLTMLVVDDELPARKELRFLIENTAFPVQILEAQNGWEALEISAKQKVDAAFIDISMGDMDGFSLAQKLLAQDEKIKIVFATAYDAYAVKAFEIQAVDYLLKPFEQHRVEQALNRIVGNEAVEEKGSIADAPQHFQRLLEKVQKISVWKGDKVMLVPIADIVLVAVANRSCRICALQDMFFSNQPLGYFEHKFQDYNFFRVNRSYLINLDHIIEIQPWFNNSYSVKMRNYEDEEIVISRSSIKEFRLLFDF